MQINFNNKNYTITSYATIQNIKVFQTLISHGIKLEDIKSHDMASDFLPELYNKNNDVAVGEILRNLRYSAKTNTLPEIWKDFLEQYGYNFDISLLRTNQLKQQNNEAVLNLLQLFVDNGIDLNDIPQRASALDILPSKFNNDNNINIGTILQYIRNKYKTDSLNPVLLNFLKSHNFIFIKERGRKPKKLSPANLAANANAATNLQPKIYSDKKLKTETSKYKKSSKPARKKVQILKLIVSFGVDLNSLEKSAMASQLLPEKSITREEDFCVGKLIYNAKIKHKQGKLNQSLYKTFKNLGVNFNEQKLISKCLVGSKSEILPQNEENSTDTNESITSHLNLGRVK